jgi:lipocalin
MKIIRTCLYLVIILGILTPAIVSADNADSMFPMFAFDFGTGGIELYLYDPVAKTIRDVKVNTNKSWMPSINPAQTSMVYTDQLISGPYSIKVYDIALQITTAINTVTTHRVAYFDKDGKILFPDSSGIIQKMNPDGTNITAFATPQSPYKFDIFWLSPDRTLIAAVEYRQPCPDYHTCRYSRIVLLNADDGSRISTMPEYLGDWNMLSWKANSSQFIFYDHIFNVVGGVYQNESPRYRAFDNLTIDPPHIKDFSGSDMGQKDENIVFYTKSGNLLSLMYQELYSGQTGALIADRASDVPSITNTIYGFDAEGEIYFAARDKTNFRRFVEAASIIDFNGDGKPDILWRNTSNGQNAVWFMNGTTVTGFAVLDNMTDQSWTIVGTGDFNNDGRVDILWRNTANGQNAVWFMNGTTVSGFAVFDNMPDQSWKIVGTGDFNNDGRVDILWRNTTSGQNAVWFMNGTTVSGFAVLDNMTDQSWTIVSR